VIWSTGRLHGWKQISNALTIHYGDRITAAAGTVPMNGTSTRPA
jgi:hypothetical protein